MIKRHRKAVYIQAVDNMTDKTTLSFGGREVMYDDMKKNSCRPYNYCTSLTIRIPYS